MSSGTYCEELHQRWSENYKYLWRGYRDSDGKFERTVANLYRGRIYGQNEFKAAAQNAEKLKVEMNNE